MKGIIFTLDSIFALAIAAFAISMLIYFQFYTQVPYQLGYDEAASIFQSFAATNTSYLALGIGMIHFITSINPKNQIWPQHYGDEQMNGVPSQLANGAANFGPQYPMLASVFLFHTNDQIAAGPLAAGGKIYIATHKIFALNSTLGTIAWNTSFIPSAITDAVLSNNLFIYTNATYVRALNAQTGNVVWTTQYSAYGQKTSPIIAYNNWLFFGTSSDDIVEMSSLNGTVLSANTMDAQPQGMAIVSGALAVSMSNGNLEIHGLLGTNVSQVSLETTTYTGLTSQISTYGNEVAFGTSASANIIYANGTILAHESTAGAIYQTAIANDYAIFQSANFVIALSAVTGNLIWEQSVSSFGANAVGSAPIISNGKVYTLWGKDVLLAQNLSTGNTLWYKAMPYVGSPFGDALAYGNLYVAQGGYLLGYGSPCPLPQNSGILYSASLLYVNSRGSCADYLLNYVDKQYNYGLYINNKFAPGLHGANFTSGGYVYIPNNATINTNTYSISLWMDPYSWSSNNAMIMGQGTSSGNPYVLEQYSGLNPIITFSANGGTNILSASPKLNTWQNVIVSYNFSSGTISMYINGHISSTTSLATMEGINRVQNPIYIGLNPSSEATFNGLIANVQIYNETITTTKAAQIYYAGIQGGPIDNKITGWYPLLGDTNDYSGLFNTGFPVSLSYSSYNYVPIGLQNAYGVSRSSSVLGIQNFTTGMANIYNVSVVAWR